MNRPPVGAGTFEKPDRAPIGPVNRDTDPVKHAEEIIVYLNIHECPSTDRDDKYIFYIHLIQRMVAAIMSDPLDREARSLNEQELELKIRIIQEIWSRRDTIVGENRGLILDALTYNFDDFKRYLNDVEEMTRERNDFTEKGPEPKLGVSGSEKHPPEPQPFLSSIDRLMDILITTPD